HEGVELRLGERVAEVRGGRGDLVLAPYLQAVEQVGAGRDVAQEPQHVLGAHAGNPAAAASSASVCRRTTQSTTYSRCWRFHICRHSRLVPSNGSPSFFRITLASSAPTTSCTSSAVKSYPSLRAW